MNVGQLIALLEALPDNIDFFRDMTPEQALAYLERFYDAREAIPDPAQVQVFVARWSSSSGGVTKDYRIVADTCLDDPGLPDLLVTCGFTMQDVQELLADDLAVATSSCPKFSPWKTGEEGVKFAFAFLEPGKCVRAWGTRGNAEIQVRVNLVDLGSTDANGPK